MDDDIIVTLKRSNDLLMTFGNDYSDVFLPAIDEIVRLRNDNNRLAWLAIDNAKDTGRALMYRKILQQIAEEGSGHGQALAYAALKEDE
jgi:hypothetical protein